MWRRDPQQRQSITPLGKFFFIFFVLLLSLTYGLAVRFWNNNRTEDFVGQRGQEIERLYNLIYTQHRNLAETIFHIAINRPQVLKLLQDADQNSRSKDQDRDALFELLQQDYHFLVERGVRQLHFHLRNNESFLRFHRPDKFGDNLSGVRATVEWTNRNQQSIHGFEEGRIYNGFRFLFPLLLQDNSGQEHLGSVEISFNALAFAEELSRQHGYRASFLIRSRVVNRKVFSDEQSNYEDSPFPGFYYQSEVRHSLQQALKSIDADILAPGQRQQLVKQLDTGKPFTLESKHKDALITSIPLRNPVSGQVVAALLVQSESKALASMYNTGLLIQPLGLILILLASLYVYREQTIRRTIEQLLQRTQKILDTQDSIIVITDGQRIIDCNQAFLDFFGLKHLDDFKANDQCVCDRFEQDDKFFHRGKMNDDGNWVKQIGQLSRRDQIVSMRDQTDQPHVFSISIKPIDIHYLIDFSNISDTMAAHFEMANRVIHDKLTGAYNREYLGSQLATQIEAATSQHGHLGIIMFDIDHFKQINDNYGHARGDLVLIQLVQIVQASIRKEDILIRWGGEEFLILLQAEQPQVLLQLAEKVRTEIARTPFEEVGQITCSLGVRLNHSGESFETALKHADEALYRAKAGGRNRVELAP
jgi:diguanylate cyclase (GGDEF)-like protein